MKRIDKLISNEGFGLRSWDDRYSKGVWVCLSPNSYDLEEVESATDAGDLDMIPATEYLQSVDWLPFVTGNSFMDALTKLEERLSKLSEEELKRASQWGWAVNNAIVHLREVSNSSNDYGGMEGKFKTLPEDFSELDRNW